MLDLLATAVLALLVGFAGGVALTRCAVASGRRRRVGHPRPELCCSFCGRGQSEAQKVVASGQGVYICQRCAHLCVEILEEEGAPEMRRISTAERVDRMLGEAWREPK